MCQPCLYVLNVCVCVCVCVCVKQTCVSKLLRLSMDANSNVWKYDLIYLFSIQSIHSFIYLAFIY